MSGECYSTKNLLMDTNSSRKDNINQETKANDKPNVKINQLLEYETMVSSAESKCSQLKGQLERIKQFYNNQTEAAKTITGTDTKTCKFQGKFGSFIESSKKDFRPKFKVAKMVRQNSRRIGTDTTGAALGTINNILAGITKSIQMPDFFEKVKAYDAKSKTKQLEESKSQHPKFEDYKIQDHKIQDLKSQEQIHGVEQIKINSKSKQNVAIKSRSKLKTSRSKSTSKTSSTVFRKPRTSGIKINHRRNTTSDNQLNTRSGIPTINRRSKRMDVKSRYMSDNSKRSPANQDLVEIYHNTAVRESKSSDSDVPKKRMLQKENQKASTETDLIPPLIIEEDEDKSENPKGVVSCIYRNYAMPTISSRMKKVAKYYMNSYNIKSIPFCPATSTTASHNIGINIQQVMSMVKTKQPIGQLSPTLAYNIALAAGKWAGNPLSFLITSEVSDNLYTHCPLSKSTVNYQHLQEIAKTIPQETIEEGEEDEDAQSPDTQSLIITGPSGDVKVTNRKQTVWTANTSDKKCTCVPQKGVEFQKLVNKFNGNSSRCKLSRTPSIQNDQKKMRDLKTPHLDSGENCIKLQPECTPLQNKEKKLKSVLVKLHDEFEKMTKTYDELTKKLEAGSSNPELNKELENLDKELNSKEEEIVMVMTLYKEVLALKQQVKALKDRTSKENVSIKTQPSKFNGYNNLTTAGLLNKLLNRIQHYQTHYKKN